MSPRVLCVRLCALVLVLFVGASITAGQDQPDESEATRDFNGVAALQNAGLYGKAAVRWKEFITKHGKDERLDRVHYYLGVCQLHNQQHDEAAATFEKVIAEYSKIEALDGARYNLAMSHYNKAQKTSDAGAFKAAANAFASVPVNHPQSRYAARALYFQGESLYSAGQSAEAIAAYQQLIDAYPDNNLAPDAFYALGVTQQELNKNADAIKTFQAFLAKPDYASHEFVHEIRLRLGEALFTDKQLNEAEKQFQQVGAVENFAYADLALLRQGQCRLEAGDAQKATDLFGDFLKKHGDSPYKPEVQLAQGRAFFLLKKYSDAQQSLAPLADGVGDQSAEASYWLSRALLEQNKADEALKATELALGKNPPATYKPYLEFSRIDALYGMEQRRNETPTMYEAFAKQYPTHEFAGQGLYMAAFAALEQNDLAAARNRADAFLGTESYNAHARRPDVLYLAAESRVLSADSNPEELKQAEALYRELSDQHPQHSRAQRALVRIGWCLYQAQSYEGAATHLTNAVGKLKDADDKAEANLVLGAVQNAAGKTKEAIAAYEESLKASGDWNRHDETLLALAVAYRNTGDLNSATDRLKRLVSTFNQSPLRGQSLEQLGEIAHAQGDHDEAINRYREVLSLGDTPFAAPARYNMAISLRAKGEHENAVAELTAFLDKFAAHKLTPAAQYLRGICRQQTGKYSEAATDLQAFLQSEPEGKERLNAELNLAACLVGAKKWDVAIATLNKFVESHPKYVDIDKAYYELGHALLNTDKKDEAIVAFTALAESNPESQHAPEAWFRIGESFEGKAKVAGSDASALFAKAASAYAQGLETAKSPDMREKLHYKLGFALYRQENFDEAIIRFQAQLKEFPEGSLRGQAAFLAGESQFAMQQFDDALTLLEQALASDLKDNRDHALYRAGAAANASNDWAKGERFFNDLLQQFPEFANKSDAMYGVALAKFNQNQTGEADALCKQITGSTRSAAQARFLRGSIAFDKQQYEEAVEHFLYVAGGYPFEDLQAVSQVEAGRCFKELGDKSQARKRFQTVIDKYPDSPEVDAAKRLLTEVGE